MKKLMIIAAVAIGAVLASTANAHAGFAAGYVSFSSPGVSVSYGYNAYPAAVCASRVVYVAPAPVVCAPRPDVVYRAPFVCAPPVVTGRSGYCAPRGYGYSHHRRHGCW